MTIETGNSIIVQEKYIDRLGGSPEVKLLIDTMYTEMSFVGYDQERALFFYYSRSKVMVFGVGGEQNAHWPPAGFTQVVSTCQDHLSDRSVR